MLQQALNSKLVNRYKNLSAPVKASFWFMFCNIIQKGISILCTPIFTRLMTPEQYGQYTIYISWYQIVTIFVSMNLSAGVYNNVLTKEYENRKVITSSFLGLSTSVAAVWIAIYFIRSDFWNNLLDLPTIYIAIMLLEVLFTSAYSLWSANQRYDYKYKGIILTCIILGVGGPAFAVTTVLHTSEKPTALILSFALIQIMVGIFLFIKIFVEGKCFYNKKYWVFALKFNLPLIPHYLSQIILNQADKIMINQYIGKKEAAMYSVAYTISLVMMIVVAAVNSTLTPFLYKTIKSHDYLKIGKITNVLIVLMMIGCVLAILIGPDLMRLLATKQYYSAIYVIPPVAASVFCIFVQGLFATIEFYFEKTRFIMFASSLAAIANIALNVFALKEFGYIAAGYTTFICYILLLFAHYLCYKKIINRKKIDSIYSKKIIIFCMFVLFFTIILSIKLYESDIVRWISCFLIALIIFLKRKKYDSIVKLFKN